MNHYINTSTTGAYAYGAILQFSESPSPFSWKLLGPEVLKRIKQGDIHDNLCLLLSFLGPLPDDLEDLESLNRDILENRRFYIWIAPNSALYSQGRIYHRRINDVSESFYLIPEDVITWSDKQRFINYVHGVLLAHPRISKIYEWEVNVNLEIFNES